MSMITSDYSHIRKNFPKPKWYEYFIPLRLDGRISRSARRRMFLMRNIILLLDSKQFYENGIVIKSKTIVKIY